MALQGRYTYDYPRPMVTVDAVVFRREGEHVNVLLIQRGHEPFKGMWALPGGFVEMDEPLEAAAARELEEETGIAGIALEQFRTFGTPGRDPRGRVITVAYAGVTELARHTIRAGDDAAGVAWHSVDALPEMACDHRAIVEAALEAVSKALRL